jgi:hypothetical protein
VGYEIIVVDNASADGSVEMVKANFPDVALLQNAENRGFAVANNQGMKIARGKYVLLLNSDTIICEGAIEKTAKYADSHPEAALVGCQVWENSATIQMTCFRFPSCANLFLSIFGLSQIFKYNRVFGREWMLWWKRDTARQVDVISGMFMLVRRTAIDQVGEMDEQFFMYCEEADWCYRFTHAGWKVLFWPGAKIIHVDGGSHSSNKAAVKMAVQHHKSLLTFLKKHRGMLSYWLGLFFIIFSMSLRLFIWAVSLVIRKMMCRSANNDLKVIRKSWAVFKYCVLRIEPEVNGS